MIRWLKRRWPGWRRYWLARGVIPRWQLLLVYVVIVSAGALGFADAQNQRDQTARVATRTNAALCVFRHDLKVRVENSERFLREHPHGVGGISAGTIKVSLVGQRRTVRALRSLPCSG